jgi:hypothetical protein
MNRRLAVASALLWGSLLVLSFAGGLYTTDVQAQLEVSQSLLGERPFLTAEHGWTVEGAEGGTEERYVPHGVGYSLLLLPAALVSKLAGDSAALVAVGLLNSLWSLLLFVCLMLLVRVRSGSADDLHPFWLLACAVGVMMLVYGRMPYDVTAAALFSTLSVLLALGGRRVWAGLALGLALLIRIDSFVFVPVLLIGAGEPVRKKVMRLLPGLLLALAIIASVNAYRFGSPLEDGHSQDPAVALSAPLDGLAGLLASPGKGLIWYAPVAVIAVLYALRNRRDSLLYLLPFALSLLLHSLLRDWSGGTGWGPRFLFPTLPLLCVPMLARLRSDRRLRLLLVAPLVWCAVATLAAVWTHPTMLEQELGANDFAEQSRQEVLWKPSRSPLLNSFSRIGSGTPDLFPWRAAERSPGLLLPSLVLQVGLAACMATAGLLLISKRRIVCPGRIGKGPAQ